MLEDPLLMIPGPVPIASGIREAMTKEMISHRNQAFEAVYRDCRAGLKDAFGTDGDLVFLNGTGSAAMEAAVSNVVGPGDVVVCIQNGKFGVKFERMARRYTDDVRSVASRWGHPIDLDGVADALDDDVAAVTMVHADTSGGIVNPVDAVGQLVADSDAAFLVDCVTSVGCERLRIDEWNVDMAVTATQKALGAPPGISALTVSESTKEAMNSGDAPLYFDLEEHLSRSETHQTPTTSPVQVFWGLQESVRRMREEGLAERIARHERFARAVRKAATVMGLAPYPQLDDRSEYANAVSVLELPDGVDAAAVVDGMAQRGVLIRSGLGHLAADTIRIGTMGTTGREEVLRTLETLQATLNDLSVDVEGDGVVAAEAVLD